MVHYCFDKALDYLGGQNRQIKKVSVATSELRMSPANLEKKIMNLQDKGTVMAVYAIAGETETGLVDPLGEIADVVDDIKRKYGIKIFTIADAAYGAPYRTSSVKQMFKDLPRYDAIIVDGHKALYTPYPNGAVLFRDAKDHALFGLGVKTPYLYRESKDEKSFEEQVEDLANKFLYKSEDYTLRLKRPEGSGSAGSILSTEAVRTVIGEKGLKDILDITLDRIHYLHSRLNKSKYLKPFHEPDVNVLCFTLRSDVEDRLGFPTDRTGRNSAREEFLETVRRKLNTDDNNRWIEDKSSFFFSSTNLSLDEEDVEATEKAGEETRVKHYVLRAVLMNPRTTNAILDEAIGKLETIIEEEIPIYKKGHLDKKN
jgi:glutamate/tyrosine decarboxylase-like PLP-dependent enzyme